MIRVRKFKRASNGYWYVRYWVGARAFDESTKTENEVQREVSRVLREIEINSGYEPVKRSEVGRLIEPYLVSLPPQGTANHKHVAERTLRATWTTLRLEAE